MPKTKIETLEKGIGLLRKKKAGLVPKFVIDLLIPLFMFCFLFAKFTESTASGTAWAIAGISIGVLYGWLYSRYDKVDEELRDTIVPETIGLVRSGLNYNSNSSFSARDLNNTFLFDNTPISQAECTSEIVGAYKELKFRTFQVAASSDRGGKRRSIPVYGLMIEIEHGREFKGITRVLPDRNGPLTAIGGLTDELYEKFELTKTGLSLVRLENPDFEELFAVSSSDPIEARVILTPKMMEHFMSARKEFGNGLRCVFFEKHIYLFIPEFSIDFTVRSDTNVEKIRQELGRTISCLEILIESLELDKNLVSAPKSKLTSTG